MSKKLKQPHKVMTIEEYVSFNIKGWHEVCRDVDGFGGVGVRYLGEEVRENNAGVAQLVRAPRFSRLQ